MREEGLLLIQQMVAKIKITTSLSLQHSAVIQDSTTLQGFLSPLQIISPLMHCKLGKDCYGLFTQEAKQKHQILMACPSSHLLLQLSGTSTVLAGERQNQVIGSWQVNKMFFSIPCFKISML